MSLIVKGQVKDARSCTGLMMASFLLNTSNALMALAASHGVMESANTSTLGARRQRCVMGIEGPDVKGMVVVSLSEMM